MSNCHVGIPRFIQEGFATSGIVVSYDTKLDRIRKSPIEKLGTSVNYYDEDVEKDLLANQVEAEFSKFYRDITSTKNPDFILSIVLNNKELITQFFSFMYMRAIKMVDEVNKISLSSAIFGDIDHSELLRIQSHIMVNPLKMIGEDYNILPFLNFAKTKFINNSLGLGAMVLKTGKVVFFMPLNTRLGLIFCDKEYSGDSEFFYAEPNNVDDVNRLNEAMVQFEHGYGNGFLFGNNKNDLKEFVEIYRNLENTPNE